MAKGFLGTGGGADSSTSSSEATFSCSPPDAPGPSSSLPLASFPSKSKRSSSSFEIAEFRDNCDTDRLLLPPPFLGIPEHLEVVSRSQQGIWTKESERCTVHSTGFLIIGRLDGHRLPVSQSYVNLVYPLPAN